LHDVITVTDTINIYLPNAPELIGTIELQGSMNLYVYLVGNMDLNIELKGGISLTVDNEEFSIDAGETKYLNFTIPDSAGKLNGLTGNKIIWALYNSKSVLLEKDLSNGVTIVDANNGKIQVKLDVNDTKLFSGRYRYIVSVVDQNGDTSHPAKGSIEFKSSPTLS
jgi:hypothetical protein